MTTSDVHVPSATTFEPAPVPTGSDLGRTAQVPFYAPFTFEFYNSSSTDPNLYSLNNPLAYSSTSTTSLQPCTYTSNNINNCYFSSATTVPLSVPPPPSSTASLSSSTICSDSSISSCSDSGSTISTSSSIFSNAASISTTASSIPNTCELLPTDEKPCEKYRQFLHSSRQERTVMIGKLVDISAEIIDSIWHPKFLQDNQRQAKIMSTRNFIQEILKRSKTTYSTLQIALFYLFRVKKIVHEKLVRRHTIVLPPTPPSSQEDDFDDQQQQHHNINKNDNEDCDGPARKKQKRQVSERLDDIMCCGRRMFLASLMVSSKYLHDKNYRNRAWAKISGLDIKEINAAELAFLRLIDYKLYVSKPTFDKWYTLLHGYVQKQQKQKQQQNISNLTSRPNNSFPTTTTSITKDNNISTTTIITTDTSSCCPSIKPEV